ncbi:hypothetical protein [Burkholderia alba]|uniref:hypothetical protein n=1 Tax=Burkholderia alba TaxID=2683677 RepID=UPI002B054ABA|nr:hypothetical protein [Burkholderia alba]
MNSAASRLDQLVDALEAAADTLHPDEADRLWHQLQAIAKTLRRAGHLRPLPARRVPAPPPGQMDLVDELDTSRIESWTTHHATYMNASRLQQFSCVQTDRMGCSSISGLVAADTAAAGPYEIR